MASEVDFAWMQELEGWKLESSIHHGRSLSRGRIRKGSRGEAEDEVGRGLSVWKGVRIGIVQAYGDIHAGFRWLWTTNRMLSDPRRFGSFTVLQSSSTRPPDFGGIWIFFVGRADKFTLWTQHYCLTVFFGFQFFWEDFPPKPSGWNTDAYITTRYVRAFACHQIHIVPSIHYSLLYFAWRWSEFGRGWWARQWLDPRNHSKVGQTWRFWTRWWWLRLWRRKWWWKRRWWSGEWRPRNGWSRGWRPRTGGHGGGGEFKFHLFSINYTSVVTRVNSSCFPSDYSNAIPLEVSII